MSRKGFKVYQLSDESLREEALLIEPAIGLLRNAQSSGSFHPALYVWEIIKIYQMSRRKRIWGAKLKLPLIESSCIKNSEMTLLNKQTLIGLPLGINRALLNWYVGAWKINLKFYLPEALEILEEQTRGERAVSVLAHCLPLFARVHDGRDIFHFILHDLMHADQFYQAKFHHRGQIGFYQWIYCSLMKLGQSERVALLANHEFSYVISDMNAYSVHLLKQLKYSLRETKYFESFVRELAVSEMTKSLLLEKNIYDREETLLLQSEMENLCPFLIESLA